MLKVEQNMSTKRFAGIEKCWAKFAEKGTIKETPQAIRARLKGTTNQKVLADCDIVIEAVIENLDEKKRCTPRWTAS